MLPIFILGADSLGYSDGTLWFQPGQQNLIDSNVSLFQAMDLELNVLVLGTDQNLWLEHVIGPPRTHIDGNVRAFQAVDLEHVVVLGTDGKLWLEYAPFTGNPPRTSIDSNVRPGPGGYASINGTP